MAKYEHVSRNDNQVKDSRNQYPSSTVQIDSKEGGFNDHPKHNKLLMRNTAGASGNGFYQYQNKRIIKKESVVKNYGEIDERMKNPNGNAFNIFNGQTQGMMETKGSL